VKPILEALVGNPAYQAAILFVALYPVITALFWIEASVVYYVHRERDDDAFYQLDEHPFVSVLVAAHNEEAVIGETVNCLLELDWPEYEVMVVDDGSTDRTREVLLPLVDSGRIRLLTKHENEGKAMALNDAIPLLQGEIILMVDADGRPQPDVLRWMVPHFVKVPRVAAVTGNPRVVNTTTLLAKLQAIEFSATISVLRRAQSTWGRLTTFSGIATALRKSAVESVGRFSAEMATEDIALAWQLQTRFHDVRYEPRAVFAMQVPETLGQWWRQRTRWARGLGEVLRRNHNVTTSWQKRRMWPIYAEAALSGIWSVLFLLAVGIWALAYASGVYNLGANPIPNFWGILMATVLTVQIACGLWLDGRYDPAVRRYALWLPLYPLIYWGLNTLASARGTLPGFVRRPSGTVTWNSERYLVEEAEVAPT